MQCHSFKTNVMMIKKPTTFKNKNFRRISCTSNHNVPDSDVIDLSKDKPSTTYLQFAEKINGRCAMQGFLWGSVNNMSSHKGFAHQCFELTDTGNLNVNSHNFLTFASVVALVTLGTAITELKVNDSASKADAFILPIFTPENELFNGRIAMLGILISLLLEFS